MSDLRIEVVKLAKAVPEMRPYLIPLLKTATPRYQDYVERKKQEGKRPLPKEEWERRVLQTGPANQPDKGNTGAKLTDPKKKYAPAVKTVMEKHKLTDDDADEVKSFKKNKPTSGAKVSPAQLLQKFLAKAKPETKKRMKNVTPTEFMKMLGAIMDEEGAETGKKASVRTAAGAIKSYNRQKLIPVVAEFVRFLIGDPDTAVNRLRTLGNPKVYPEPGEAYLELTGRLQLLILKTIIREFDKEMIRSSVTASTDRVALAHGDSVKITYKRVGGPHDGFDRAFEGATGRLGEREGKLWRVYLDRPVIIPGGDRVTDDLWEPQYLKKLSF